MQCIHLAGAAGIEARRRQLQRDGAAGRRAEGGEKTVGTGKWAAQALARCCACCGSVWLGRCGSNVVAEALWLACCGAGLAPGLALDSSLHALAPRQQANLGQFFARRPSTTPDPFLARCASLQAISCLAAPSLESFASRPAVLPRGMHVEETD